MEKSEGIKISKKAFVSSLLILFVLMVVSWILTQVIPQGAFSRTIENGKNIIVPNSFKLTGKVSYPIYRIFTAPFEVFLNPDSITIIVIIIFIAIIGGSFAILDRAGVLKLIIANIVEKYENKRFRLIWVVTFTFMFFGAFLGIFEETITLVPIAVIIAYSFGWDALMGLGMSILATCFGFSAAISNPFTIGVAQKLAGIPVFSGSLYRFLVFFSFYILLSVFLTRYAKKIEKNPEKSLVYNEDKDLKTKYSYKTLKEECNEKNEEKNNRNKKALRYFLIVMSFIIIYIFLSTIVKGLSDYSMPAIGLIFLIAGVGTGIISKMKIKELSKTFINGAAGIAPGIILIMMAMSVKQIITSGGIMDTILFNVTNVISKTSPLNAALIIYALVLFMNFFIGSGSAKAFLMMPLIIPIAQMIGLSRQVSILAFCFGDGFSNIIYPTNPVLLIALGLTTVSYPKWFKWTIGLQLLAILLSIAFVALSVLIKYGPF